jgi:hypothetical protein
VSDPGGFPGSTPPPVPNLDEHMPGAGLDHTGRIDPWGESGPATTEQAAALLDGRQRAALLRFPTYGDPELRPVEFTEAYARLAASMTAQLAFVEELIAAEYQALGISAFRTEHQETVTVGSGPTADTQTVPTGQESMTVLITWQAGLQTRLAKVLADGIKIGIKARQADLVRRYGEWVATAMQEFAGQVGIDWDAQPTRRAAQRAVLKTRERLQLGVTPADAAGPALTDDERAAIRTGSGS